MKNDNVELTISFVRGDDQVSISTGIKKYVNELLKYKELFPDDVELITFNDDDSVFAKVPLSWFRFIHPKVKKQNLKNSNNCK